MSEEKTKQIAGLGANAYGRIVEVTDDNETLVIAFVPPPNTAEHHDNDSNGHGPL